MNLVSKNSSYKKRNRVFAITFNTLLVCGVCISFMHYNTFNKASVQDETVKSIEENNDELYIEQTEVKLPLAGIAACQYEYLLSIKDTSKEELTYNNNEREIVKQGIEIETEEDNEEADLEEEEEEIVEEPEKPNKLYCVVEDGITYNLKPEYQDYLWAMCEKYNVTDYYELFIAQMYHESSFNETVISSTNDYGIFQINKCNHDWLGNKLGNHDFLDPYNCIEAGVYLMSTFLEKYNDVQKALVCYNMGEGKVINGTYSSKYSRCVLSDKDLLIEIE